MSVVNGARYRILVADDNQAIHEDFSKIFAGGDRKNELAAAEAALFGTEHAEQEQFSFELVSAHQGAEALAKIQESVALQRPFGAAFVDMRMPPGWDGVQTVRRLWQVDPDLQVVLCTAYSDYSWQQLIEQLGVTDRLLLLKKPFDKIEALLLALALSEKRRWIQSARSHMARLEERVKERTAALQFLAETDRLTGLTHREVFLKNLQLRIDHQFSRVETGLDGVLFIDLDDFKVVNDSLGHAAGDELLQQVARRLVANTRHDGRVGSHVCARLGGDEFAVLAERIPNVTDLLHVAERILEALHRPFTVDGREVRISASVGAAIIDGCCKRAEELLTQADTAMYEAKKRGKGRVMLFDHGMSQRMRERMELEQSLHRALDEDQFQLAYQPVVSLDRFELSHYEALLRWRQPDGQFILPAKFLPIAQQCRLIEPIGRWVIEASCRQLAELRAVRPPGTPPRLSINVAGRQLMTTEFVPHLSDTLKRYGVAGDELILEVTEADLSCGTSNISENLESCRALGIEIHMDDFGTGASSLNRIRAFPFTGIKLDRSCLVSCQAVDDYALIRGILALASALELQVIAEGIETEQQFDRLRRLGCRLGQGYWIGRPSLELDPKLVLPSRVDCDMMSEM